MKQPEIALTTRLNAGLELHDNGDNGRDWPRLSEDYKHGDGPDQANEAKLRQALGELWPADTLREAATAMLAESTDKGDEYRATPSRDAILATARETVRNRANSAYPLRCMWQRSELRLEVTSLNMTTTTGQPADMERVVYVRWRDEWVTAGHGAEDWRQPQSCPTVAAGLAHHGPGVERPIRIWSRHSPQLDGAMTDTDLPSAGRTLPGATSAAVILDRLRNELIVNWPERNHETLELSAGSVTEDRSHGLRRRHLHGTNDQPASDGCFMQLAATMSPWMAGTPVIVTSATATRRLAAQRHALEAAIQAGAGAVRNATASMADNEAWLRDRPELDTAPPDGMPPGVYDPWHDPEWA